MRKSARYLGKDVGLSDQAMNVLLKEEGYLDGEPGNYTVTEKGRPYVSERHWDAGDSLNAGYVVTSWDEEILDVIGEISDERRCDLNAKVAAHREEKRRQAQERREALERTDEDDDDDYATTTSSDDDYVDIDGKGVAIIIGVIAGGFLLAKGAKAAAPHVQRWWGETAKPAITAAKDKVVAKLGHKGAAEQANKTPVDPAEAADDGTDVDAERVE